MDPVTHGFLGANIRYIGFDRRWALYVLVVAAMFPDIDYLAWIGGADSFMRYHRGVTHSVFALFLMPGVFAVWAARVNKNFIYYYALGFLGYASHVILDLLNPYGTRVLAPLDQQSFSLDILFVLDPLVSFSLFMSVLWVAFNKKRQVLVPALVLVCLLSYVGLRYYFHEKAEGFLKEELSEYRIHRVVPQPGDIMGWWFVSSGKGEIKVGYVDLYTRNVSVYRSYPAQAIDPIIEATRRLDVVDTFLRFAQTPYADIRRGHDGTTVVWRELAYDFIPGDHFIARIKLDRAGKVLKKEIVY